MQFTHLLSIHFPEATLSIPADADSRGQLFADLQVGRLLFMWSMKLKVAMAADVIQARGIQRAGPAETALFEEQLIESLKCGLAAV